MLAVPLCATGARMTICITGWRSKIAEEFRALLPDHEKTIWGKPAEPDFPTADRYLFCHGLMRPTSMEDQTQEERDEGWLVNFISTATQCDWIIAGNPSARICIIGSESAFRDSFDGTYAVSKQAIHSYVRSKRLRSPGQQLVAISPGIIEDCGMTTRRHDLKNLGRRRDAHPKGRFLMAREVASLAHHLLYENEYISGTVIRMHGGQR